MCHLLLLLPMLGLPVFWLWPIEVAAPVYAVIFAVAVWTYGLALRSAHRPVETGREAILHGRGRVVNAGGRRLTVQLGAELWNAESRDALRAGDEIRVLGVDGLVLNVARLAEARDGSKEVAHGA
ncbi:serine protease [Sulfurifustis variabilis]|uniref:Serine protease n=1 Tax=Sulfurifustis variabilis TaxID=1675686 RepID=A0A1C7AF17_9GAMM|nr:NfeD family protein [Sulfurifustis variabilis]BAU49813.1 serine protease [Sulfurifustis variabilis]